MLKAMLNHAWNSVPYYRSAWTRAGIHPDDVRSLEDLRHFPIVTKTALRGNEDQFLSSRFEKKNLIVKRTSGSTGVPLTIYLDKAGKEWKYASTLRSDEWSGWRLGQRVAKVWGNPEYRHFGWRGRWRNALLDRAVYLDTCHLTDERIEEFTRVIRRHRPGLLFGHAHSLFLLAERMQPGEVRPNGIISTAMPLHDWQRRKIEGIFGTKVTDRYGCEEVSLIACECERHHGLHINSDSIYVEIERHDESHTGNLLITDLTNMAMPLIRYRNGDVVTLTDRRCECGRGLPMIEKVQGRDADYVVAPSGALISGISLTENFALKIDGTAQMQIVQEAVTHLRIRIVPAESFGDGSRRQIAGLVRDTFGEAMRHDVELVRRDSAGAQRQVSLLRFQGGPAMTPLISAVMAAKNYARFLPMAVRSVQAQSFPNWELLIIDDGSTDHTCAVVKPFLNDARIRYVKSDYLGQSRAKNLGVRLSCGAFIAFLDADDAWRPSKLSKQLLAMQGDERIGVIACDRELIDENTLEDSRSPGSESAFLKKNVSLQNISIDEVFVSNPICFSSVLVRRAVFERVGGFDPNLDLSIDYDLWLRVAAHFEIACLREKLVLYRTGHGNLSKRQSDRIATAFTIMERRKGGGSKNALAEGYASTHRSLGWLYRRSEPMRAIKAYLNALVWPNRRVSSIKGAAASIISILRGRETLAQENQPQNC